MYARTEGFLVPTKFICSDCGQPFTETGMCPCEPVQGWTEVDPELDACEEGAADLCCAACGVAGLELFLTCGDYLCTTCEREFAAADADRDYEEPLTLGERGLEESDLHGSGGPSQVVFTDDEISF